MMNGRENYQNHDSNPCVTIYQGVENTYKDNEVVSLSQISNPISHCVFGIGPAYNHAVLATDQDKDQTLYDQPVMNVQNNEIPIWDEQKYLALHSDDKHKSLDDQNDSWKNVAQPDI